MHARLKALRARHDILESKIHGEMTRPMPDDLRLTLLKRMKLKLRDEIAGIEYAMAARNEFRRESAAPQPAA